MATSKNQRSGPRQKQRKSHCPQGHELVDVLYVPAAGRAGMRKMCACTGYVPIENLNAKKKKS
jgi:hypothetical protein